MALYFVSYDLRGQHRNYPELDEELETFNAVKVLESTYCLKRCDTTARALRDHFKQFLDGDDGLCVTKIGKWATHKTDGTPKDLS